MLTLVDLILTIPNFISSEDCDYLINEYNASQKIAVQESSVEVNELKIKKATMNVVKLEPHTKAFNIAHKYTNNAVEKYIEYLAEQKSFFTEMLASHFSHSHNYRLLCYNVDESIHDHIDSEYTSNVHGSCSLILNDDYEGGEFKFFKGQHKIKCTKGSCLVWPANPWFVHGVDKITKGKRYSVNSFLCTKDAFEDNYQSLSYFHPYTRDAIEKLNNIG